MASGSEVALQKVGGLGGRGVRDGGALRAPAGASSETAPGHEAGDPFAGCAQAPGAQRPRDARRAVGAARGLVGGEDLSEQLRVAQGACARTGGRPAVVGGAGDLEEGAGTVY